MLYTKQKFNSNKKFDLIKKKFNFNLCYQKKYRENFEVRTVKKRSNLNFVLSGVGVDPNFSLSFEGNLLDFGYCLSGDRAEKSIEVSCFVHFFS